MPADIQGQIIDVLGRVRSRELDRDFLPQHRLDVVARDRVSAFPWRGQFTPGLVGALLESYGHPGACVLDPFAGSGTTLVEANRRGMAAVGAEINPAAAELARTFVLTARDPLERKAVLSEARQLLDECMLRGPDSLFGDSPDALLKDIIRTHETCSSAECANLIAVTMMLAMGDSKSIDSRGLRRAFGQVTQVVADLPQTVTPCAVHTADARVLPLADNRIDTVITSPPYINVFNYHQNYRPAIELLGWRALSAAKTEIGANRKHRQNRFLTVVQYALDMMLALQELCRVCRPGATIAIVIGRESRVRGISFANGELIGCLAELLPGLRFIRWQERSFTTRFGQRIYEEILAFENSDSSERSPSLQQAAEVGRLMLREGMQQSESEEISSLMEEAILQSAHVRPSPELSLSRVNG